MNWFQPFKSSSKVLMESFQFLSCLISIFRSHTHVRRPLVNIAKFFVNLCRVTRENHLYMCLCANYFIIHKRLLKFIWFRLYAQINSSLGWKASKRWEFITPYYHASYRTSSLFEKGVYSFFGCYSLFFEPIVFLGSIELISLLYLYPCYAVMTTKQWNELFKFPRDIKLAYYRPKKIVALIVQRFPNLQIHIWSLSVNILIQIHIL